jgi:hypothetical protein
VSCTVRSRGSATRDWSYHFGVCEEMGKSPGCGPGNCPYLGKTRSMGDGGQRLFFECVEAQSCTWGIPLMTSHSPQVPCLELI